MLPKIPTIHLVLSKDSIKEEFKTYSELVEFVLNNIPEVSCSIRRNWISFDTPKSTKSDEQAFNDYCFDWIEDYLADEGYQVERIEA